jgi:hypothetical protein
MREPVKYTLVFLVVLALQYANVGLHYTHLLHGGSAIVVVLIAGIMVLISACVFMELARAMAATRIVALLGVVFVALLCLGMVGDVWFR